MPTMPSRSTRSVFRPRPLLVALAATLATPLAAQLRVQPRFTLLPSGGTLQLEARVLHHPSQACDWSVAAPGRVGPDGRFQGPPGTYTVRATSRADPATWADAGVVVLPGELEPALDLVAKVLGPEAVTPGWSTAWPFQDIAGPGRFGPPGARVHTLAGTGDLQARILGYGLRVPVVLPRTGVIAGTRLLSYLESGEPVRLEVTGDPCPELRVHGVLDRAQVESLDGDGRHWTSQTLRLRLRVRGLVPLAGSAAASPGDTDGIGLAARFRRPAGLAALGCGSLVAADPVVRIPPHLGYGVQFQRKTSLATKWVNILMPTRSADNFMPRTATEFVDEANPAPMGLVGPNWAPRPAQGAPVTDLEGRTWLSAHGQFPFKLRFASRFVGAEAGPWSGCNSPSPSFACPPTNTPSPPKPS